MEKTRKNITREDVARIAGVSHMTVTRVLNESPLVKEETKQKVLQACEKLQFRRNLVASSLRSRKSNALAVIVPTFRHEFYSRLLSDIEAEAQKENYCIIASQFLKPDQNQKNLEWNNISDLLGRNVDGFILDADMTPELERKLAAEGVPVVCINRNSPLKLFDAVLSSYEADFAALTAMLLELGHRNIVFVGGFSTRPESREAFRGFCSTMEKHGLHATGIKGGYSYEDGEEAAEEILEKNLDCTAVVCISDYVAMGLIARLEQRKIKVPQDISVTGYAGDFIAGYFRPPITTAQQPTGKIACNAVGRLVRKIKNPELTERFEMRIPAEIIRRQSVRKLS